MFDFDDLERAIEEKAGPAPWGSTMVIHGGYNGRGCLMMVTMTGDNG